MPAPGPAQGAPPDLWSSDLMERVKGLEPEQDRRRPEGPARALLRIAATHPEAVFDALAA